MLLVGCSAAAASASDPRRRQLGGIQVSPAPARAWTAALQWPACMRTLPQPVPAPYRSYRLPPTGPLRPAPLVPQPAFQEVPGRLIIQPQEDSVQVMDAEANGLRYVRPAGAGAAVYRIVDGSDNAAKLAELRRHKGALGGPAGRQAGGTGTSRAPLRRRPCSAPTAPAPGAAAGARCSSGPLAHPLVPAPLLVLHPGQASSTRSPTTACPSTGPPTTPCCARSGTTARCAAATRGTPPWGAPRCACATWTPACASTTPTSRAASWAGGTWCPRCRRVLGRAGQLGCA